MSQHHGRIHLCLLWTIVLTSITIQLGFITYYFTGHHHQLMNTSFSHSMKKPGSKMASAKATEAEKGTIQWILEKETQLLSLEDGNMAVNIKKDGYYFVCLQVTMANPETWKGVHKVRIKINKKADNFLEGEIANLSLSTGFLGRVKELSAGDKLVVTIEPAAKINGNSGSHLGVIYMSDHKDQGDS